MAWPVRYRLVGLLASGSMINYVDRVNISVAAQCASSEPCRCHALSRAPALCTLLGVPMIVAAALVPWAAVSVVCITLYMYLANLGGGACWACR